MKAGKRTPLKRYMTKQDRPVSCLAQTSFAVIIGKGRQVLASGSSYAEIDKNPSKPRSLANLF